MCLYEELAGLALVVPFEPHLKKKNELRVIFFMYVYILTVYLCKYVQKNFIIFLKWQI